MKDQKKDTLKDSEMEMTMVSMLVYVRETKSGSEKD